MGPNEIRAVEQRIAQLIASASSTTPPPASTCSSPASPATVGPTTTFTSSKGQLVGWSDEDVMDIVEVTAMFNFTNRVANALGWKPNSEYHGFAR